MSEADWHRDVQKGQLAAIELDKLDPWIDKLKSRVYKTIEESKFSQNEAREEAYYLLRAVNLLKTEFRREIDKGKKSANLLEQARSKLKLGQRS